MARAKHTVRAEARRRYRQAANLTEDAVDGELDAPTKTTAAPAKAGQPPRPAPAAGGRPGFLSAFRGAYHPAHLGEDLRALPKLLTSRALLAGSLLVIVGAAAYALFPRMTGGTAAWDMLVVPSSGLAPALVAGFFARRASYLLGAIVGLVQAVAYSLLLPTYLAFLVELGAQVTPGQADGLRVSAFTSGPFLGMIFASLAAWYRRFLSLSSPRRPAQSRGGSGRPATKAAPKRSGR